jgi:transposase
MGKHRDEDLKKNILRQIMETKDYHKVAWSHGISDSTVYGWLKREGFTPSDYNQYSQRRNTQKAVCEECESLKTDLSFLQNQNKHLLEVQSRMTNALDRINDVLHPS